MEWAKNTKFKTAVILILFFFLYSYRLDFAPVHFNQDELEFSLNAYSIATTGRSQTGMFFPIYFPHLGLFWSTPFVVYLPSLLLTFLPFSEATVRLSSVFIAILSGLFIYLLGQKLFKNQKSAIIATFIMLTSPALFINSRVLLDNTYTIPFVLVWLLFLKKYIDSKKTKHIIFGAIALGIGIHSYHAAKIVMPLYAVITATYLFLVNKKQKIKAPFIFLIFFVIPFVVFIPWFLRHPDSLLHQVKYISGFDNSINVNQGLWGVFNLHRLLPILRSYLTYFSPEIIFLHGDKSLIHSTGQIGVFSYFVIPLFILGIISMFIQKNNFTKFFLIIFLTFPIASAIVNEPQRISRSLVVIPLLSIIATYGYDFLISSKEKISKHFTNILILLIGIHFTLFLYDYFGNYAVRAQSWFNYNIPGAMQNLIALENNDINQTIYLDEMTGFVDRYYKFYAIKEGASYKQVKLFNYLYPPKFENNSLILLRYDHSILEGEVVKTIYEPNGMISFYILRIN